uniref:Uncharacterized protein n=1 Tax=Anguilla anguilla TaxID=7936 RepID=A0A0E9XR05_ANGAN
MSAADWPKHMSVIYH